jgi:alpha-glucosidase
MLWDDSAQNGFSTRQPWNTGRTAATATAVEQSADPTSMLNFYRQLIQLKKQAVFADGDFCLLSTGDDSYAYRRQLGAQTAYVAVNLSDQETTVTLPEQVENTPLGAGEYTVSGQQIILAPHAGVVLTND